ncbi:hypothetical protein J2Z69_001866 [Paenibacillus shirakamiensis]|uniref:Uncharacterized protein n=1 Tax=Paenibacillus shirakamiensis TaxID=1265935 RepID=A0ABS4JGI2_9BACL|nr:hypothetical protein [Paenibacillus shirakamiensis]MBP2000835.1 hypothetical protein [Paenibacillus shirakamiensis]
MKLRTLYERNYLEEHDFLFIKYQSYSYSNGKTKGCETMLGGVICLVLLLSLILVAAFERAESIAELNNNST